jgi:hypothetical protein
MKTFRPSVAAKLRGFVVSQALGARTTMFLSMVSLMFFCLFFSLFSPSATAQEGSWTSGNRLIVQGGLALPVANFGAAPTTLQSLFAVDSVAPVGLAQMGFTAGLTDVFRFSPNFALSLSLDVNYNPYDNAEAARQFSANILSAQIGGTPFAPVAGLLGLTTSIQTQPYINGALTGGLRYDLPVLAGLLNLYANAQAGLLYGVLPRSEATLGVNALLFGVRGEVKVTRPEVSATAFAYKLGVGVLLFDRVNVGVNYLASSPSFLTESSVATDVQISQGVMIPGVGQIDPGALAGVLSQAIPAQSARFDFPTNVVQITVGYAF